VLFYILKHSFVKKLVNVQFRMFDFDVGYFGKIVCRLSLSLSCAHWCLWHISRNVSISSCPSPICRGCQYPCCTSPL